MSGIIMNMRLRNFVVIGSVPVLMGVALAAGLTWPGTVDSEPAPKWVKVSVELPVSQVSFPPGNGSVIANAYCLICHSAGMVLSQPPLTKDEWTGEINKMRNAFGAPLPADQVEALAEYLGSINGLDSSGKQTTGNGQGG